jgi:hypothetical protein
LFLAPARTTTPVCQYVNSRITQAQGLTRAAGGAGPLTVCAVRVLDEFHQLRGGNWPVI